MKHLRRGFSVFGIALIAVVFGLPANVLALDISPTYYIDNQQYNRLISDSDFIDINSLSVAAIQNFLATQGSYLAIATPDELGDTHGRSAAQIIWDAAHGKYDAGGNLYDIVINESTGTISPKAILVTLQKEQSLVTLADFQANRLRTAMGYACPDSGGCNANYAGFTKQVEWGSWQLRYNYEIAGKDNGWWNSHYGSGFQYRVGGGTSMSYGFSSPSLSGTVTVGFNNQATAALYRYTPHITYGNYNFWKLSRDWFEFGGQSGTAASFNDTSSVELETYNSTIKVQGAKGNDARVYYNNQLVADSGSTSWSYNYSPDLGRHDYTFQFRDGSGASLGDKLVTVERHKTGDINGDNSVNLLDLSLLSTSWGVTVQGQDWRNLNPDADNNIDLLDISIFANNWGE